MPTVTGKYTCGLCGWKGERIHEQAVTLLPVDANWRYQDGVMRDGELGPMVVFACHKCGAPVKPS